ncbi:MAG: hypothetical protein Q8M95_15080 [Candidatus Methanoperedens sp.]|nr:hypothetical protein [Candidatus Methanoperedens sp.]
MKKIVLIALIVLTQLISPALAITELKETIREITLDYWSETRKVAINEYLVYKFQGINTNTVDVTLEVVSGDSIDIFLLNSDDFADYQSMMRSGKSRKFNSYSVGMGMNLKYINYSFEIPADGTYYIVQDNTYLPNGGASPGRSAEVNIKLSKTRCLECEEAALEEQRIYEEAVRQYEEEQKRLQEEIIRYRFRKVISVPSSSS